MNFVPKFVYLVKTTTIHDQEPTTFEQRIMQTKIMEPIDLTKVWELFVAGSVTSEGSRARLITISLRKEKLCYALKFEFLAYNN